MFTESYAIFVYSATIVYSVTMLSYSTYSVLYSTVSVLIEFYSVILSLYAYSVYIVYSVIISNITKVSLYSVFLIGSFDLMSLRSV